MTLHSAIRAVPVTPFGLSVWCARSHLGWRPAGKTSSGLGRPGPTSIWAGARQATPHLSWRYAPIL